MITALVFLGTGVALFLLMLAWRDRASGSELEESAGPSSPSVMRRIVAREDMQYVASLQMPRVQRFFLQERRRLALDWLRASRDEAILLLRRHKEAVRHSHDIRPAREARIAASFASFVMVYSALVCAVRLFGPFRAPAVLQFADHLTGSLESLAGTIGGVAPVERRAYSA